MSETREKAGLSGKKIVFFDIDGTLVDNETHRVPESAVRAIRQLRENGHLAFINTGRTWTSVVPEIREIGFDGYVCGCGTHIYFGGETLFAQTIPHEACVEVIHKLRELKVTAFFESERVVYYDSRHPIYGEEVVKARDNFRSMGAVVEDFPEDLEGSDFTFDKFYCLFVPESDVEGMAAYAEQKFHIASMGTGHLEAIPKGMSKAEGIRFLEKRFGIRQEDCYAIGDSDNDIEMMQCVPNAIAMGVCSPGILRCCSYQTDAVGEDGILHALQHFGLV